MENRFMDRLNTFQECNGPLISTLYVSDLAEYSPDLKGVPNQPVYWDGHTGRYGLFNEETQEVTDISLSPDVWTELTEVLIEFAVNHLSPVDLRYYMGDLTDDCIKRKLEIIAEQILGFEKIGESTSDSEVRQVNALYVREALMSAFQFGQEIQ